MISALTAACAASRWIEQICAPGSRLPRFNGDRLDTIDISSDEFAMPIHAIKHRVAIGARFHHLNVGKACSPKDVGEFAGAINMPMAEQVKQIGRAHV